MCPLCVRHGNKGSPFGLTHVFVVVIGWLLALFDVGVVGLSPVGILCAAIYGAWLDAIWKYMFLLL